MCSKYKTIHLPLPLAFRKLTENYKEDDHAYYTLKTTKRTNIWSLSDDGLEYVFEEVLKEGDKELLTISLFVRDLNR